jgi:hypothetical protein
MSVANRFSELPGLDYIDADMLYDAYEAITVTGSWGAMKNFNGESFMFYSGKSETSNFPLNEPFIANIMNAMEWRDRHSGASFGCTLRVMEFIAKNGWDAYVAELRRVST